MGKLEAIDSLRPKLAAAMQEWLDSIADSTEWESLEIWIGNNIAKCMADAATSVLHGVMDTQEYLTREGQLK